MSPLNEGRGRDPGDTLAPGDARSADQPRSTKAGAETPATHHLLDVMVTLDHRSTKAGAETPATLGCHRNRRVALPRSTKAGAETPATPHTVATSSIRLISAQRRPGPRPRRHPRPGTVAARLHIRSTKAGAETPATPGGSRCRPHAPASAQRRPGPRPRRHPNRVPSSASL